MMTMIMMMTGYYYVVTDMNYNLFGSFTNGVSNSNKDLIFYAQKWDIKVSSLVLYPLMVLGPIKSFCTFSSFSRTFWGSSEVKINF